ncbi:MAG: hypothetical protein CBC03_09060 [Pseudoalteromonas sp. TMED43]|nr:MAG: hypothetical protein CBC03_09060 [Pseudoalteromonas sp. TMED43]
MTEAQFDIWPVLEHYGWELPSPRGSWQSVKCQIHNDTHASCRVSYDAGRVKCLACDFRGDAIQVVQHYEGLSYKDAVSRCEEVSERGSGDVLQSSRRYSRLPSKSRNRRVRNSYTPPRLRQRPGDRA